MMFFKKSNVRLKEFIEKNSREGELFKKLDDDTIECLACAHHCKIRPERSGICRVRLWMDGSFKVPWGYTMGLQIDPIEKKPFYHVRPGSLALSYGMVGCNFHCSFCQNWITSQALRDNVPLYFLPEHITIEEIINAAKRHGTDSVISTYNEPLITSEWNAAIFDAARKEGLLTGYVSNGFASEEVLEFLQPRIDVYKVDLKTFNDETYRKLGGRLQPVLDTIEWLHAHDIWVEVVTLIIPDFNDSPEELKKIARFIADVSVDIPWHVTAFHPDYKMLDARSTPVKKLLEAVKIGKDEGLNFVYPGNVFGGAGKWEHTWCPRCENLLIKRRGFYIQEYNISDNGNCMFCGASIPGVWQNNLT